MGTQNRATELILSIENAIRAITRDILTQDGHLSEDLPNKIAVATSEYLANAWGGQQIYVPRDMAGRNARILREFTGDNVHLLAEKYRLSVQSIYKILAHERIKDRGA